MSVCKRVCLWLETEHRHIKLSNTHKIKHRHIKLANIHTLKQGKAEPPADVLNFQLRKRLHSHSNLSDTHNIKQGKPVER